MQKHASPFARRKRSALTRHGTECSGGAVMCIAGFCVCLGLMQVWPVDGCAAVAPYDVDSATIHLLHFDEPAGASVVTDAVAGGVVWGAVSDGATLGNPGFAGFGYAASTYDGGPGATLSANPNGYPGRDAYIGPVPFAGGSADWADVTTINSSSWAAYFIHSNAVDGPRRFWRLEIAEGGFAL